MIDLAIIGGGPAGSAAALEARRRGMSVAIWERDRFPRDKVCGEFISPEAVPLLAEEIPETLGCAAFIHRAEFISRKERACGFELPSPARGLSRRALDEALWRSALGQGAQASEGAAVRRVSRISALEIRNLAPSERATLSAQSRNPSLLQIATQEEQLEDGSGSCQYARTVLVATGRWWAIQGLLSPGRQKERVGPWLGAKAHFRGVEARDAVEMYCFPGGYCGLAPIEDGLYNACCLVHRDLTRHTMSCRVADFADWICRLAPHPALAERLKGATQVSETVATAPVRMAERKPHAGGILFAGDAAGFLDPFTGDGIAQALHGGRLAATSAARLQTAGDAEAACILKDYQRDRRRAVRRSYRVARLIRLLVRAPEALQAAAAAAAPWIGVPLLAETRWRPDATTIRGLKDTLREEA